MLSKASSEAIKKIVLLSRKWNFSEFIISFIFIGIIAIAPEFLIGVVSALEGKSLFGAGVVIGSNIADLTIIIGLVAFFTKGIKLTEETFSKIKKLTLFSFLPFILFIDGNLSRIDGLILILAFIIYLIWMLKKESKTKTVDLFYEEVSVLKELFILILSVLLMIFSAHIITTSAEVISLSLVIPIFFIGIVVAIGTCLPELILAVKSNLQNKGELGLGDILGNVFADILLTLGVIALINPIIPAKPLLMMSSFLLVILSLILIVLFFDSGKYISKREGFALIIFYFFFLSLQFVIENVLLSS